MRKDAIQPSEDVGQMSHAGLCAAARLRAESQSAGKVFRRRKDIRGPIEGMAAIVDGAAGFGRIVHGTEVLPLGCPHLGASLGGAGRRVGEEGDDKIVDFHSQEATQLVEP